MGVGEATTVAFDGKSHRLNDQHGRTILENLSENGRLVLHRNGSGGGAGVALHFGDDVVLGFGNAEGREPDRDSGILWSTGDASNHAMVLFVGQSNQVLHIVEHNDRALDFNVSANTADPELIIHSSTTPATDYLRIGAHTGAQAVIAAVGGTLDITAVGRVTINDGNADVDTRIEGVNNANLILVDAASDSISFGGGGVTGAAHVFVNRTNRAAATAVGAQIHLPAQTQNFTNASSTIAIGSTVSLGIPTYTGANATLVMTNAATLYIAGIPIGGSNVTISNAAHALWVAAGVRFDGPMHVGADGVGTDGEQLTSGGIGAVMDWSADTCIRESKKDIKAWGNPRDALDTLLGTQIYNFHYKGRWEGGTRHPSTSDYETMYTGPMADEAPWAMHHHGRILNRISALGYTVLSIQALQHEIVEHETRFSTIEDRMGALQEANRVLTARVTELEATV
jgi:hypothetical protein